jgi:hypothetical protein
VTPTGPLFIRFDYFWQKLFIFTKIDHFWPTFDQFSTFTFSFPHFQQFLSFLSIYDFCLFMTIFDHLWPSLMIFQILYTKKNQFRLMLTIFNLLMTNFQLTFVDHSYPIFDKFCPICNRFLSIFDHFHNFWGFLGLCTPTGLFSMRFYYFWPIHFWPKLTILNQL